MESGPSIVTSADIGHLIRSERSRQALTQTELAEQIGTTQRWISEIENGKACTEIGRVSRWLQALGVERGVRRARASTTAPSERRDGRSRLNDVLDRLVMKPTFRDG